MPANGGLREITSAIDGRAFPGHFWSSLWAQTGPKRSRCQGRVCTSSPIKYMRVLKDLRQNHNSALRLLSQTCSNWHKCMLGGTRDKAFFCDIYHTLTPTANKKHFGQRPAKQSFRTRVSCVTQIHGTWCIRTLTFCNQNSSELILSSPPFDSTEAQFCKPSDLSGLRLGFIILSKLAKVCNGKTVSKCKHAKHRLSLPYAAKEKDGCRNAANIVFELLNM